MLTISPARISYIKILPSTVAKNKVLESLYANLIPQIKAFLNSLKFNPQGMGENALLDTL